MKKRQIFFLYMILFFLSCNLDNQSRNIILDFPIFEIENNSNQLKQLILTRYKNKAVYVDVGGPWCRGCREEVPSMKLLQDSLSSADVVFLFLCVKSNKSECQKFVIDNKLVGEHYYSNDLQSKELAQSHGILAYPTYLIYNRTGKCEYQDAPRPRNNLTIAILKNL